MDLYLNHYAVKALSTDDLTLRALDLQAAFQDCKSEITRVKNIITSTRNSGTFDYVTARKQAAERLAQAAITGIEIPEEQIAHAPSDQNLALTIEGLTAHVSTLNQKLSHIKSEHRLCIITLAERHIEQAGEQYINARAEFVRSAAAMQAVDHAMQRAGLPATNGIYIESRCELPILQSEKNGQPYWSKSLASFIEPHLKQMPNHYRDQVSQLGLSMTLE
jgi:hypothetical protein